MKMVKMVRTVTECFEACGKKYKIMQDENGNFWGIDFERLNSNKEINGISGNLGRTLNDTLRQCYERARIAEILDYKEADDTEIMKAALQATQEAFEMFGE